MIHLEFGSTPYRENLPINYFYISRSDWRFYYKANNKLWIKNTLQVLQDIPRFAKGLYILCPVFLFFSWNFCGRDRIVLGILHKFAGRFTEKNKKFRQQRRLERQIFLLQGVMRTAVLFFKTMCHTIQMIQFRSISDVSYFLLLLKLLSFHYKLVNLSLYFVNLNF